MKIHPFNWIAALLVSFSPEVASADSQKPAVVLVHGIYDSGKTMKWLS
jgi:hypothetical protein